MAVPDRATAIRVTGESGSAILEMVLVLPLLLGLIFGALALSMGAIAQAVVTGAARDAGRVASIECGQGEASWWQDAESAAHRALSGLHVSGVPSKAPSRSGQWGFSADCPVVGTPGVPVSVVVVYEEVDLFPPATALLSPGSPEMSHAFHLVGLAQFPAE